VQSCRCRCAKVSWQHHREAWTAMNMERPETARHRHIDNFNTSVWCRWCKLSPAALRTCLRQIHQPKALHRAISSLWIDATNAVLWSVRPSVVLIWHLHHTQQPQYYMLWFYASIYDMLLASTYGTQDCTAAPQGVVLSPKGCYSHPRRWVFFLLAWV